MTHMRRWGSVVVAGCFGFALIGSPIKVHAQIAIQGKGVGKVVEAPPNNAAGWSSVRILENGDMRRTISVGRDCIKDKDWKQAVQALQFVLNEKQDHYVKVTDKDQYGKEFTRWTSVKFEANNLIGSMDKDGLDQYELNYGKEAKDLLDEAKSHGDRDLLADVAQRYCHTKAGLEANEIVATLFLARGQVFTAALRFEKLLDMDVDRTKISDLTLFKAALAFRRAGDTKNFNKTWSRLETALQNKPGLRVGNETIALERVKEVVNDSALLDVVNLHDWPRIRGNQSNTAQAHGSPPLMDAVLWKRPLLGDKLDGADEPEDDRAAAEQIHKAIEQVRGLNQPILPGFFPIVSQGIMVYRTQCGVTAVALKDMSLKHDGGHVTHFQPGEIFWKSMKLDRSLSVLLSENKTRSRIEQWINTYQAVPGYTSFLFDNSLLGTLSTDHRFVYAINDLAVPPIPHIFQPFAWNQPQFNPQEVKGLLMGNELHAYDLFTGKRVWDTHDVPQFKDSHFLGQPISVGGKLYVLNEKVANPTGDVVGQPGFFPGGGMPTQYGGDAELRLIGVDPGKTIGGKPFVDSIQVLGSVGQQDRFLQDPRRRVNAAHLGFAEGILVCPTNAGEVFGIELMTRSLLWSYPYRESAPAPIMLANQMGMPFQPVPQMNPTINNFGQATAFSKWKTSPPALQDGKVVFTAPDADSVHCISLRDGKFVWKRAHTEGDQYMAGVFQGKVLIVGKTHLRALNLKDGTQLWSVYTGSMPSGQGVATKGVYYLPLADGEILAIDIEKGQIKAHNRTAVAGVTPGNLIFYEGMVLSQTTNTVAAYPQLVARLETARTDAAKNPDDAQKTTEYGELLLKDGQVRLAVETLLKVYNKNPAGALGTRVKDRLFEALTDLLQTDFDKSNGDYLSVYQTLCAVPTDAKEEQQRKAKYFRIVGQGRESQGNLVEAFQMYKDFGALPMFREQGGIPSQDDPTQKIPVSVWLRGRIAGMFAKASPEQREPLEAKIAEEWKTVAGKKDPEQMRSFVGMFDVPFKVGRDARIRLAESIMERNERDAFLEAELLLYQVMGSESRSDPQAGGRALASLAQLEEKKGTLDSMRLAASYYRELGQTFAKSPVRGAKTGADLVDELATDKRFLPFLENPGNPWGAARIAAHTLPVGAFPVTQPGFLMSAEENQTTFARQYRLVLDPSNAANAKLSLRDVTSNHDRWTLQLGYVPMNQQPIFQMYQQAGVGTSYNPNARFRFYHVKGHLIVCQVGVMVYCLDGDTGKKLWEMQTVENVANNGMVQLQQMLNDAEGNPEFLYFNRQTGQQFRVKMGRVGAAQASYVAILGHKGLTVADPLRGTQLWKRNDVPVNSHVFGDDQYLFLVEASENGSLGAGRTLRASDGEALPVDDFSNVYLSRVRVMGRQILAAQPGAGNFTLRLYDIVSGKDAWSRAFPPASVVLQTEDADITGVIDPTGQLTVLDALTGKEILQSSVLHGRINLADLKTLKNPFLMRDKDRFYVALNKPIDVAKITNGALHNNFSNATRCHIINGWFLALHGRDGERKVGDEVKTWKKGDFAWHSYIPIENQLMIVEQFGQSPVVVFSARHNERMNNGGNRWASVTQSLQKTNGKMVYDSGPVPINGVSPYFYSFLLDAKARTVNLIGFSGSVQHYVDDGKGPPSTPQQGAQANPGGSEPSATANPFLPVPPAVPGGAVPGLNGRVPLIRRMVEREVQVPPVPVEKKE